MDACDNSLSHRSLRDLSTRWGPPGDADDTSGNALGRSRLIVDLDSRRGQQAANALLVLLRHLLDDLVHFSGGARSQRPQYGPEDFGFVFGLNRALQEVHDDFEIKLES